MHPESRHFTITDLGGCVFAAIHKPGGWAIANAGFVDLGEATLVYDTCLTPRAAMDLKELAESLTGNPVAWVVNSHYHNDHIWGNSVFSPQADILSGQKTRQLILTEGAKEVELYQEISQPRLEILHSQYEQAVSQEKKRGLLDWIDYFEGLVETMPILEVCLPNITFRDAMTLHMEKGTVELRAFSRSHTAEDTVLYLPEEGILFLSDLLFVNTHPYLGDGEAEQLLSTLEALRGFQATHFVPGHGPVGTERDLDLMVAYIHTCQQAAERFLSEGRGEDEFSSLQIPEKFSSWQLPMFYPDNVRALVESKR